MKALRVLDAMSCSGLVLDPSGHVLHFNTRAKRLLGRGLELCNGKLVASEEKANRTLQALLREAPGFHGPAKRVALAISRDIGSPLVVRALPMVAEKLEGQHVQVLVAVIDPDDCLEPSRAALRELFGLTDAETRVAVAVTCGCSLQDIARSSKTGIGTVRQQLKAVLTKTQTGRQAELVTLLTRLSLAFAVTSGITESA